MKTLPLSQNLLETLGWTLLHSLWQGLVLAVLLLALLFLWRKKHPHARYMIALSGILGLFLCSLITFGWIYFSLPQQISTQIQTQNFAPISIQTTEIVTITHTWQAFISEKAKEMIPYLVNFWILGIALLSLKFLGNMWYLQRLKHHQTETLSDWQDTVKTYCEKWQISKKVRVLASAKINTPLLIGYFKPVILLPLSLTTQLSASQIEVIVLHELAHIRRNDYLINLIVSWLEIIFFYHPLVWWLGKIIIVERENCCDDMVVNITKDKQLYAHTLLALEEIKQKDYPLAMGFAKERKILLQRVKRLFGQYTVWYSMKEKLSFCILLILGLTFSHYVWSINLKKEIKKDIFRKIVKTQPAKVEEIVQMTPKDSIQEKEIKDSLSKDAKEVMVQDSTLFSLNFVNYSCTEMTGEAIHVKSIEVKVANSHEIKEVILETHKKDGSYHTLKASAGVIDLKNVDIEPEDLSQIKVLAFAKNNPSGKIYHQWEVNLYQSLTPLEVFLADENGYCITNFEEPIPMLKMFKIKISEAAYQVKKVTVTQFKDGKAVAHQEYDNALLPTNDFDITNGNGFQIYIQQVVDKEGKNVKITEPYIGFFVK
jgi:beta-lactamase regulating signal transducer with metallopeptidase domain